MAHEQQLLCVKQIVNALNLRSSDTIVEIGSWDVNGSVRQFFDASTYIGLDLVEGKGVDRVYDGQNLTFLESNSIDVAISCECFEHNPFWRENLNDMVRITQQGGIIIVTCASRGRFEHGTTRTQPKDSISVELGWEYYKNIRLNAFKRAIRGMPIQRRILKYNPYSKDLYVVLQKHGRTTLENNDFEFCKEKIKEAFYPTKGSGNKIWSVKNLSNPYFFFRMHLPLFLASYTLGENQFQNFQIRWRKPLWNNKRVPEKS